MELELSKEKVEAGGLFAFSCSPDARGPWLASEATVEMEVEKHAQTPVTG